MSQLQSVQTFADSGPNAEVNGSRMNSHVNDALLLNGAVLDQTEKTTPLAADTVLLGDSTVLASGYPKKVQVGNLLLESQRNGSQQYVASDTGSANAYAVALAPAATAYSSGMVVRFKAANASTGASTINVNGLGVKTIKTPAGGDTVAGDILAGQVVHLVYDGTYFQMLPGRSTAAMVAENLRTGENQYAADSGAADAYVVTLSPAPTALTAGLVVRFTASATNTGAATVNVNGLGSTAIKNYSGAALVAGQIKSGAMVTVVYDGTNFQLVGSQPGYVFSSQNASPIGTTSSLSAAHGLGQQPGKVRAVLVCTDAGGDAGYAQNDEVDLAAIGVNDSVASHRAATWGANATNVFATMGSTLASYNVCNKGTGADTAITTSKWTLKVYASL